MITISICMIVKNEEHRLAACLDCLKHLAEEIIIVDTGSTDETLSIAKKYTDKIFNFPWQNDFSAARNFAFSKAAMEYIYTADADELLDEDNQKKFLHLKEVLLPEIDVVQMYYTNQLEFGSVYNFDKEYRGKLYKRLRTFSWVDPIHETVCMEPLIYDSEIEIIHKPHESHAKRDFLTYQNAITKETPLSEKLVDLYARELYISGDEDDLAEAIPFFQSILLEDRSLDNKSAAHCILLRHARLQNDMNRFFTHALFNIAHAPNSETCCELGNYYASLHWWKEALLWYNTAIEDTESILDIKTSGEIPKKGITRCMEEQNKI